jgi:hypothetical protein
LTGIDFERDAQGPRKDLEKGFGHVVRLFAILQLEV